MKFRPTLTKGLRHFYSKTGGQLDITFLACSGCQSRYRNFARDGDTNYRCVGASSRLHTFSDGAPGTIPRDQLDATLADPKELSGVLNKTLEAIAAIRTRGLSESESTRRAMDEFRKATDPLAVWLDRHTVLRPDAVIPQDRLYQEYSRHCSDAGRPTISKTAFGRAMKKLRPSVGDYQRTVNGVLAWCYVGIGLATKEDE
jgi:hypothetical protein